jgi:hypothetical protein
VDVIQTPTCWTCQPKLDQEQWARVNHQVGQQYKKQYMG